MSMEAGERRCPLCGDLLLGWTYASGADPGDRSRYLLDRCEGCGLALLHDEDPSALIQRAGAALGPGPILLPNRASLQASLAGKHWFRLRLPMSPLYLTPRSLALLCASRGLELSRIRFPLFGPNQFSMWQTLLNGVTFHDGFATTFMRRLLGPSQARSRLAFGFDLTISVLAALPAAIVSVPLELAASLVRRGGVMAATATTQSQPDAAEIESAGPRA